ncbi:MAG: M3 family metallopeptidase [Betaproteobacteria bacterium]|nr:M3 family metallopeptidase [Betaproteobacteria bacterium]
MNPLLDLSGLPRFSSIDAAHVKPAISTLIDEAKATIARLVAEAAPPTWVNFVTPLEDANERLSRAWGVVSHLNAVRNSAELRAAYNEMLPVLSEYSSSLAQNEALFAKYRTIRESKDFEHLTPAQQRTLENELRDFRLGGAELSAADKPRFQAIQAELSSLAARYNDNVLDATNGYAYYVSDEAELAGVPADVKQAAQAAATAEGKTGWKLTLHIPCYLPLMQYADSRALRERLYRAYTTRASELGADPKWDNSTLMKQILELRTEKARLLGYANYAELSLATKMAESPADVLHFIDDMTARAKPFAQNDWGELTAFAQAECGLDALHAWDVPYVSEKLRQKRYAFSADEVKQYFTEPQVLAGLFRVVETIYGLKIQPAAAETWHPDVRFFEVRNGQPQPDGDPAGALIGQFYLDLYARPNKRGGAWMGDAINRRRILMPSGKKGEAHIQRPVAYMVCNFAAPVGDKPALLTHSDVITLFHEFGHGLHQLLTEVDELGVSGVQGVEWDAVELPSQFMENFCWEWAVLAPMTRHVDNGLPLPRELFDKMIAAKNFQAGMGFMRQLEFALLDMRLHTDFNPAHGEVMTLMRAVREAVAVVHYPDFNRMPHTFTHIFGGGYAAGYYSYKWAEVLSADVYAAFEEAGVLCAQTGARFRHEILSRGGSRPAMESFIAIRGRKPDVEPLLRHNGMRLAA